MSLIAGNDEIIAEIVARGIPVLAIQTGRDFYPCKAFGIAIGDNLVGGVVFHDFQPAYRSVEVSIFANNPHWATKDNIADILRYPFVELKVRRLSAMCGERNERAKRLLKKVGFAREGVARWALGDDHGASYSMLNTEWKERYG